MIRSIGTHAPRWRGVPLEAVLFDLDGTLLDSAGDVATALNRGLWAFDLEAVEVDAVRQMIGGGAQVLIERTLARQGRGADLALRDALTARFLRDYEGLVRYDPTQTHVYPGVADGLRALHAQGLRLAVVTNKHQRIATDLLGRLGLGAWIDAVIGRDNCERGKPDPQPLHLACQALHIEPRQALMVGDSANDVTAARAAGMGVVCVPYGYTEGQDPRSLACDAFIDTLADLPVLLRGRPAASSLSRGSRP